jgi:hypothetical protein
MQGHGTLEEDMVVGNESDIEHGKGCGRWYEGSQSSSDYSRLSHLLLFEFLTITYFIRRSEYHRHPRHSGIVRYML